MKLKINSSFIIANLVLVPLYFSFTTYFFFRGNSDAYDYVDTYLKQSKVIKLTIPKLYEEKRERYKFRDGRKGARDYREVLKISSFILWLACLLIFLAVRQVSRL